MQWETMLYTASTWVLPVLIAITLHEAAHGFVAHRLGDDTAYRRGRVTFNPLSTSTFWHDPDAGGPFARAVACAVRLRQTRAGQFQCPAASAPRHGLVALAGPGINIALAIAAALLFHVVAYLPSKAAPWVAQNFRNALVINVVSWRYSTCCRSRPLMAAELLLVCFPSSWPGP